MKPSLILLCPIITGRGGHKLGARRESQVPTAVYSVITKNYCDTYL